MRKNKWFMFFVLYFSACVVAINQFKVPPIMAVLAENFSVGIPQIALLMTAFSIIGIVITLPSGLLVEKIGVKPLGVGVLVCLVIGSIIGALSGTNFTLMMIGRIIEGSADALILMLGILLIDRWFEPNKVGVPTGIFTTFPAVAPLIMLNIGGSITESLGWQALWWGGAVIAAIAAILFITVVKVPDIRQAVIPVNGKLPSVMSAFGNRRAWLLAIVQGAAAFTLFTFLTVYPLIFEGYYGLSLSEASRLSSLSGLIGIFVCILSGILIQKTGKPALINIISFAGLLITCSLTLSLGSSTAAFIAHIFAVSIFSGLLITSVLALAPSVAKTPMQAGAIVAMVDFIYYIGMAAGAPIVTSAIEIDWQFILIPLVGVAALGFIATLMYQLASRKVKRI
jgi:predicted MFS family arabinose efflux permease